jgi:hypothetical protein
LRRASTLPARLRRSGRRNPALDRTIAARELGFTAPTANSIDATSDRDFILEYLHALTFVGLHLSRFAEEITLFATAEFGFVILPSLLHRLQRHAAEEKSRPHRAHPRQSRPHPRRGASRHAAAQRPAAGLQ